MTTETTAPAGGFTGDPLAALNPPTASTGCCSSSESVDAQGCCGTASAANDGCCSNIAASAENAGCC